MSDLTTGERVYTITATEAQAQLLSDACDIVSRLMEGQLEEIAVRLLPLNPHDNDECWEARRDSLKDGLRGLRHLMTGLDNNRAYLGIHSRALGDSARQWYDLHRTLSHRLFCDRNPNPDSMARLSVHGDPPWRTSTEQPLARVTSELALGLADAPVTGEHMTGELVELFPAPSHPALAFGEGTLADAPFADTVGDDSPLGAA